MNGVTTPVPKCRDPGAGWQCDILTIVDIYLIGKYNGFFY
jgi:hypothetical protein